MPIDLPGPNERVKFWNKIYRVSLMALVIFTTSVTVIVLYQLRSTTTAIRKTQTQAQATKYIKCLALARFDVPSKELNTRKGAEAALDKCADQQ